MENYSHMELQDLDQIWLVDTHLRHWQACLSLPDHLGILPRIFGFINQLLDRRLELMADRERGYRINARGNYMPVRKH
jgi:hypothetical protein